MSRHPSTVAPGAPSLAGQVLAAAVLAAIVLAAATACTTGPASAVPYTDSRSTGGIVLYDKDGTAVTSGRTNDRPFVAKAVGQAKAPDPYDRDGRKATLLAFLPRQDADPTQWHGRFLTGASAYPDPAHPTVVAPDGAGSLGEFLDVYPTQWDGLVQLRIYLGVPGEATLTSSYATADIRVSGDRWTVVRAGRAGALGAAAMTLREGGADVPIEVRVDGSPAPSPAGGGGGPLPRTGTDVTTLAGAGALLVAAGVTAVVLGRRRRAVRA
ncbi:LPXTG cell wall anchor domain-containing protein [Dactylosporangium aurantiacum]|uniref:LPXTG cell wall anchor domain-containing protein n=1 Tax=Dactylosporangium aurantiacum TaxID=35754 RepID=A0A9Q9IDE1_9ACTN|nr:LPXTG cell wall anchor domain-containing protein [Dactylosporangium aurantiacum]MDG6101779.1 LPXTG cell wall anchor domain-containing protein [Dactylosporangium aurantiacum]UWZ52413.1 LPXTG cell wall anchor domain-containing protein [Dactylosporangium aurantiacum]